MKRIIFIVIIIIIFTLKITNKDAFLLKEFNIFQISTKFNNKEDDVKVSKNYIEVLDVEINENEILIKPIGKFSLPISGVITNLDDNKVCVSTISGIVEIYYNGKCYYHLYQYYNAYSDLITSDIVKIKSIFNNELIGMYRISNEKI